MKNVKKSSHAKKISFRRAILPASIIAAITMSGSASAFKVEIDNPDLDIRWDNTFRYNAGWRMSDPKNDLKADAVEQKFKSGDMVTNRIDVLSEFDVIYKKDTGFRVSAAGWYDSVYNNHKLANGAFLNNDVPKETRRYYNGPSGEFLDAFVFTKFNLADVPINVKLGRHTIYWGETLFSLADGISSGQSYADLRKAVATPGAEAKEIFKPLGQFSFSADLSSRFTVMGQYFYEHKIDLFPLGGTYFSPAEFVTYQGQTTVAPGMIIWDGLNRNGAKKSGDWGIGAKWGPEWLDGSAGFYYREYTPKNGMAFALNAGGLGGSVLTGGAAPAVGGLWLDPDAPRTKLYGFSLSKQVWGISWGLDVTYRKDATLAMDPFSIINGHPALVPFLGSSAANGLKGWAPIGDIYTSVFNMIAYDGKRDLLGLPLYDSAVLTAELNWDGLDKVTKNRQNFGGRANCTTGTFPMFNAQDPATNYYGCATNASLGVSIQFEPKWFQVIPRVDLSMPIFYSIGLHGNTVVPAVGSMEGMGVFSYGLTADVDNRYNFALTYNGQIYKRHMRFSGPFAGLPKTNAALGDFSDRGWISLTAKATW